MLVNVPISEHAPSGVREVDDIPDTPENRKWIEAYAIPRCLENRTDQGRAAVLDAIGDKPLRGSSYTFEPAPYCVSAYCPRCTVLRGWAGVAPVLPNAWMFEAPEGGNQHG